MILDLRKINYNTYEKIEIQGNYKNKPISQLEQDISRSYSYLRKIHIMDNNEVCVIRAILLKDDTEKKHYSKELQIHNFDEDYEKYRKFIKDLYLIEDVEYNFFYHISKMDKFKIAQFRNKYGRYKFIGRSENLSSCSILAADFDGITETEYREIKKVFLSKGIETIDIWTGNGVHMIVLLDENITDKALQEKWLYVLEELGLNPDLACSDMSRVFRLPFFYNTKTKYESIKRSEIISNTKKCYSMKEVFSKMGFSYENITINKITETKHKKIKKTVCKSKKQHILIDDVFSYYKDVIDTRELPLGVQNMLKGLVEGFSNNQVRYLVTFLKSSGYPLNEILLIMEKLENINGNSWNDWQIKDEVIRFFENYNFIDRITYCLLEREFGVLVNNNINRISSEILKYTPKEIQLYLLMKYHNLNGCKKTELLEYTNMSSSSIDRLVGKLIVKSDRKYYINEFDNNSDYIKLSLNEYERILSLDEKAIKIYLYIKKTTRGQNNFKIKKSTMQEELGINRNTISHYLKELVLYKLIYIKRGVYNSKEEKRQSDAYSILIEG